MGAYSYSPSTQLLIIKREMIKEWFIWGLTYLFNDSSLSPDSFKYITIQNILLLDYNTRQNI